MGSVKDRGMPSMNKGLNPWWKIRTMKLNSLIREDSYEKKVSLQIPVGKNS